MRVLKDCADENCPSFGLPEAGEGDMAWVQGADPADPSREIRVLMPASTLRALAGKLTAEQ